MMMGTLLIIVCSPSGRPAGGPEDFSDLEPISDHAFHEQWSAYRLVTTTYGSGEFSQVLFFGETPLLDIDKSMGGFPDTNPEPQFQYDFEEPIEFGGDNSLILKSKIIHFYGEPAPRLWILANEWGMH
jgi:hypothetical protein